MATPRTTGGTLRQRLFGAAVTSGTTPFLSGGPGQGMSWSSGSDRDPYAPNAGPFYGRPRKEQDSTFRTTGSAFGGIERARSGD